MKITFFYAFLLIFSCHVSLGMERDESPMRIDSPRGTASQNVSAIEERASISGRVSPTPPSSPEVEMKEAGSSRPLDLELFTRKLREADQKIDFNRISSLYKEFLSFGDSDAFWEQEAGKLGAIKWGRSWKDAVGGHLFLNTAINPPHMSLIATALQELTEVTPGNWEEIYGSCREKVAQIIRTHPYFRRRTGLYALGAAYSFNHPIGQLLFVEALDQLETEEDKRDLERARPIVSLKFKSPQFLGNLREFLSFYPNRIKDLQGDDLKDPDKLREYSDLGLPHYRILLAECLQKRINWGHLNREGVSKKVKEFFPYYLEAGEEGDFEGYFLLSQLVGISLEDSKKLADTSFLQGNRKPFSYFSKEDRKVLYIFLDLYKNLKKFFLPHIINK